MKIHCFNANWLRSVFCLLALVLTSLAQTPEISSQDAPVIFRSTTNLIPVPVVVRDSNGKAIGNLAIDDFQLFDNGKPQAISKFSVETFEPEPAPAPQAKPSVAPAASAPAAAPPAPAAEDAAPSRFVAYLFDDLHLSQADLVRTREAALRQIDRSLNPGERVALYTTSGRASQEFTADPQKIHAVLTSIQAMASRSGQNSCPQMDFYESNLIYNKDDVQQLKLASEDALVCLNRPYDPNAGIQEGTIRVCEGPHDESDVCTAVDTARRTARIQFEFGDRQTESALNVFRAVVNRMTAMPGKRAIVIVSPGFLVFDNRQEEETDIIDRAIKGSVVIGGLDARGLYSQVPGGDASTHVDNPRTSVAKLPNRTLAAMTSTDVISNLASGTGGAFYQGTNDFDEGMARVAATPEYIYVLGFSPQDLKLDGSFHTLKVTLKNRKGFQLQVRKGYYAANYVVGPAAQAKQQIQDAFFSREEIHDLPAVLQTQFFKLDNGDATLSAVTKIDAKQLPFRKEAGRNSDDVTVVTGIFDSDGNYVSGQQKVLQMKLLDRTLQTRLAAGISVDQSFTVHPGRYTVRMVVRDTEGKTMTAQSSVVDVP